MKPVVKKVLQGVGALLGLGAVSAGGYAAMQTSAYDTSMAKVYDVPLPHVTRSTDPLVLARGKHLTQTLAGCGMHDCHTDDLGGGMTLEMGPVGKFSAPNITPASLAAAYSDGELARLIKHGIRKDGQSIRFMPVEDFSWLPESDVDAIISYVRSVPAVDRPNGPTEFKTLGKILDRRGALVLDVARHIDHAKIETPPAPEPTAAYGAYIARLCTGCHGEHLSGGPIPGTPPSVPVPLNLTPDATGLKDWSYDDFIHVLATGTRKSGTKLNAFMPFESLRNMDETERHALWAYLQTVPARPFGER